MACNIFINHFSLYALYKNNLLEEVLEQSDTIYCDGILLVKQLNYLLGWNIKRYSFDWSSIADKTICTYESEGGITFWGGSEHDAKQFTRWIKDKLNVSRVKCFNGFSSSLNEIISHIQNEKPKAIVIGRGSPIQEIDAITLKKLGIDTYTCGGFITQVGKFGDIYGGGYSKLPRWLIRIIRQPYVIKRVFYTYPISILLVFKLHKLIKANGEKFRDFRL
ncbi:WecB/TagA/CpsF family glycosyltransferase [Escherichia coli]